VSRRRVTAVGIVVAIAVALTGCAGNAQPQAGPATQKERVPLSQLHALTDPKDFRGPSTATLTADAITPIEKNPLPVLPVTVQSHDRGGDVPVKITTVRRIVAFDLAGSIAGTIAGLGLAKNLVGRDVATTFPEAKGLPLVTSPNGQAVNAEAVLAVKPTIVITDGTVGPMDVIAQLRTSGIPVVFVKNPPSFDGAEELARQVGAALGLPEVGGRLADRIASQITAEKTAIASIAPKDDAKKLRIAFLYLRGDSGIYYLFGEGSGADALIDGLGGIDAAEQIGWAGMRPMTDEALITMNPDLIMVMTKGLQSVGGIDGLLQKKPAVGLTAAGKNKRVVDMADGEVLSFGPRSADILDALARAVYAPGAAG
jgi:iron complex transport system substrate-binding protein